LSNVEDITEYKLVEMALNEASLVFDHTHEGIIIADADTNIIRVNHTFTEITGYTFDDVTGKKTNFIKSGTHSQDFYKKMWDSINNDGTWYGEIRNRRKNGEYFATLQSITAVKDEKGAVTRYVSIFSDISELKSNEIKLTFLATHDALTSLPNRTLFHDNLNNAIHIAKRNKYKIAILFLDLNRFKEVNDTLGHEVGDRLLKEVAMRLKESVREEDTVARLGGDEFAIILPELKENKDAIIIAQKIIRNVHKEFLIGQETLFPSTSIGISIYPEHADNVDTLVKLADKAMYVAKEKTNIEDKYELFNL
jgi:diguanylate cyclase (GGDEF)-like protein/PAS domain S-box-containing protein